MQTGAVLTIDEAKNIETVAEMPDKILAVKWSPTEEHLVLATGKFLLLLDSQLNPQKETPIDEDELEALRASISWSADGKLFAICYNTGKGSKCLQRNMQLEIIRGPAKADPEGGLIQSVSEKPVEGLLEKIAIMPSGSYVLGVEDKNNQVKALIWEKNGLRHSEFLLSKDKIEVIDLGWTLDGLTLAVAFRVERGAMISFYQRVNYKWYNKNTLTLSSDICGFKWLSKKGRLLLIRTDGKASIYQFESTITGSVLRTREEKNFAGVAVTDSDTIYISHFDKSIIPPPMSNYQIRIPNTILKACYSSSYLALLSSTSLILLSTTNYQNIITLTDKSLTDALTQFTATQFLFLEYSVSSYAIIIIPSKEPKQDQIFVLTIIEGKIEKVKSMLIKKVVNICSNAKYITSGKEFIKGINSAYFPLVACQVPSDEKYVLVQYESKVISMLVLDTLELLDFHTSPQLFQQMLSANLTGHESIIGLTEGRKLYINTVLFAEDVTSVLVTNDLLFFTKSTSGTSHLFYMYDLLGSLPVPSVNVLIMV